MRLSGAFLLTSLLVSGASACPGFTNISTFNEVVHKVLLGFEECTKVTGDSTTKLEPFESTRFVWTIRPSPDDSTHISSSPPGLVRPMKVGGITGFTAIAFNVGIPNFSGEGGVLIEVPADHLEEIQTQLSNGAAVMAQIEDGFTQLRSIQLDEFVSGRKNDVPGDGAILKAKATASSEALSVTLRGSGIHAEVEASDIKRVYINARNSDITIKAANVSVQDSIGGFNIRGSSLEDCNDKTGCSPDLNVLVQGSFEHVPFYDITHGVNLRVNDPTGTFRCEEIVHGEHTKCSLTDEEVVLGDPLPCTNSRKTAQDIFYCENEVPIGDTYCRCTPVAPPPDSAATDLLGHFGAKVAMVATAFLFLVN